MFENREVVVVEGVYLGKKLDLRPFRSRRILGTLPLLIRAGEQGVAALFRYGVMVTFDLAAAESAALRSEVTPLLSNPFGAPETEPLSIRIDEGREEGVDEEGTLWLRAPTPERMQIVSEILAKSIVLAHYEAEVSRAFERIEPMAERMASGSRPPARQQTLLTELGEAILAQTRTIGRVETGDKPEITWEDPELDRLYVLLAKEYELREREGVLRRKTALVSDTTGLFIDLLAQRQSIRVEWYIVILILIEIVLILYELFVLT